MTRYSIESRTKKNAKEYGCFTFALNLLNKYTKNCLILLHKQRLMYYKLPVKNCFIKQLK